MLNINGKLLEELDESEYYLFSILLNYGTKSRPDNGVLMHRTKWGLQKLQKVKKSLVSKGLLSINARFDRKDNKRGRASNEYKLKTKLASKYNGVQLNDFHVIEIQLDENQLHEIQLDDFKLDENQIENKVLKYSIIETIKLLKEESKKALTQEKENLLLKIQKLEAENIKLKNQSEAQKGKEKSCAKKEKKPHVFPSNEPRKKYKPSSNGFPSMEEFDEMPKHEEQITTKYEAFLKDYKYSTWWNEDLKESFLEWCAYKNEILLGSFGATNTKAVIREIKDYLKAYDIETICKSIQLSLKEGWKSFDPQRVINRENKKKQDAAKQQANSTEGLYESWARIVNEGLDSNGNANGSNTVDTSWADA